MTSYAEGRKPHVRVSVEQVIDLVTARGVMMLCEIAEALDISVGSARRKADGAVYRGALVRDEFSAKGTPLPHEAWRYCEVA